MEALFFHSYLFAFLFWSNLALGSSAILMIYQLTGGAWGEAIDGILIAATRTIYTVAALFIPILFGIDKIYIWANPARVLTPRIKSQSLYLNPTFFSIRGLIYFLAWTLLAYFLVHWSETVKKDPTNIEARAKVTALSAGGLVLYGFTISFAAIDWVMSLEPSWSSTVYGMVYAAAQGMSAFAFVLFQLPRLSKHNSKKALNDIGNILLAFIMFWAYVSILQYVIIWSGNIPDEALWFNHRTHGGWQYLIVLLALFQFAGPFLLLLFKDLKRNVKVLSFIGMALLLIRIVDVFWFVMPAFHPEGFTLHWVDILLFLGVGTVWLISFGWSSNKTNKNIGGQTSQKTEGLIRV